jgi:Na+-transporting NADH:ubiquinone oxidoreductase subunit B
VFNPALTGRAFVYVSFGGVMTAQWTEPFAGFPGGLGAYALDAVTGATPGILAKAGVATPLADLVTGAAAGVMGGTSAALTALCGLTLVWRRVASHRIVAGGLLGFVLAHALSAALGGRDAGPLLADLLAGGFLFGVFFFATDPVTASQTDAGRWLYGLFIGAMSFLIKTYSAWPSGTMFAILLANTFAPAVDMAVRALEARRRGAGGAGSP